MERLDSTSARTNDQGLSMVSGQSTIVTPLRRPQPLLATAFSFDSGFEVSPVCLYSFQYGESMPSNMTINSSSISGKNAGENDNGSVQDDAGETLLTQEDIEGVDDELISIDQHFTPIHSPASVADTKKLTTMAEKSKTTGRNDDPNLQQHRRQAFNLALQRRENRLNQINMLARNWNTNNNNNNDPCFPNAYDQDRDLFEFDRDIDDIDEDYDDVFLEDSGADTSCLYTTPPPLQQYPRPSCVMMFGDIDQEEETGERKEDGLKSDFFDISSGSSRSSSTPIPIPGANSAANKHHHRPRRDRRSSLQFFKDDVDLDGDMVDGNSLGRYSYPEYSLPDGRRMPYYHRMAPRLDHFGDDSSLQIDAQPETIQSISPIHQQSSSPSPSTHANSTSKFGSRLAVSFSMIRGNREPTCYSPPPLFNNHPMNGFLFRFDRLEPNRYGGNRALPLFGSSMLATHPELHEDEADDDDDAMVQDPWTRTRSPSFLQFPMSPPTSKSVESAEELGEKEEDQVSDPGTVVVQQQPQQQQPNLIGQNSRSTTLMNVDVIPQIDRGQPQCSCRCGCRCYCCGRSPSPCITQPVVETVASASRSTPLPDVVFNCQRKAEPQSMLPLPSILPQIRSEQSAQNAQPATNRQQLKRSNTDYYSDHNYLSAKYRNTLPSFPQVPSPNHPQPDSSHYYNNYPNGTIYHNNHHNGQIEQRRTMSVSLPIDHETIVAAGRKLRQISTEFHLLQLQRSASLVHQNYHRPRSSIGRVVQQSIESSPAVIVATSPNNAEIDAHDNGKEEDPTAHSSNAVSFLRTFLELLTLSPIINNQNHSSNTDNAQRRGGRRNRSRRQTPTTTTNSSGAVPRQVNNSIFYTGQPVAVPQTSNSPNTSAAGDPEVI